MKKIFFLIILILVLNDANATEIVDVNTSILGKDVNTPLQLFSVGENNKNTLLYPSNIQLDIENNLCKAISMLFPDNKIKLDEMRKIINTKYPDTEYIVGDKFWAWRVENGHFTITMFPQEDCIEDFNYIRVIYLMWVNEDIDVIVERGEKILNHLQKNIE